MAILKAGATAPDGTIDVAALHAKTWAAIRPLVTQEERLYLTKASRYVEAQYLDPKALFSQLPLYESKHGYILP